MPGATFRKARAALSRWDFLRREDGTIAIEAMIIMPALFWTYLAMFSTFHTFETYSLNQKAAFTVSDAISRETLPIDSAYLDGAFDLFEYLARSKGSASMRVSVVYFDAANDRFLLDWSQNRGAVAPLTDADIQSWNSRLPTVPDNERVILVETWNRYDPPFKTGLEEQNIHNFVFNRPRYAPQVCWNTCG